MNGYQRALKALNFEKTDFVPTFGGWVVSADFFEYITGRDFWQDPLGTACLAYQKLEVDIVLQVIYLPYSKEEWRAEVKEEELKDQKNYKSPEDVVAYIETLDNVETLRSNFDFEAKLKEKLTDYQQLQEKLGSDIFCMPEAAFAKFTWFTKFGYENYLMAMALYPDKVKKLFEYSGEQGRLNNSVLAELVKQKKMPPYFFLGNDICGNRGPMASPEILRDIFFPSLKHAFEPLVDIDAELVWHSDGYFLPIINDLIASGVSGFQGFQEATGYNISEIANQKVRNSRKPILFAGLEVDRVLPFGTQEDVKSEIDRIVEQAGDGGGLFIGTANTAGPDCPSENLEVLYKYPRRCQKGYVD